METGHTRLLRLHEARLLRLLEATTSHVHVHAHAHPTPRKARHLRPQRIVLVGPLRRRARIENALVVFHISKHVRRVEVLGRRLLLLLESRLDARRRKRIELVGRGKGRGIGGDLAGLEVGVQTRRLGREVASSDTAEARADETRLLGLHEARLLRLHNIRRRAVLRRASGNEAAGGETGVGRDERRKEALVRRNGGERATSTLLLLEACLLRLLESARLLSLEKLAHVGPRVGKPEAI